MLVITRKRCPCGDYHLHKWRNSQSCSQIQVPGKYTINRQQSRQINQQPNPECLCFIRQIGEKTLEAKRSQAAYLVQGIQGNGLASPALLGKNLHIVQGAHRKTQSSTTDASKKNSRNNRLRRHFFRRPRERRLRRRKKIIGAPSAREKQFFIFML